MTKRKRVADIEVEVVMFRSKLQDELDQGLKPTLKENCYLFYYYYSYYSYTKL